MGKGDLGWILIVKKFGAGISLTALIMLSMAFSWYGNENHKFSSHNPEKDNRLLYYPSTCGSTTYKDPCGTSLQLNAEAGQPNYTWSDGSTGQSITVTASGEYWWQTIDMSNNQVVNGDFTQGNQSFTSGYGYAAPNGSSTLYPEGLYTVTTNPKSVHDRFTSLADHTGNTTGPRNMMVVNGSQTANVIVWKESISVTPNTYYLFSIWLVKVSSSNPANLNFSINGTQLGQANGQDSWTNFTAPLWYSGSHTTADIAIVNQNTVANGNDFALDDIVFAPVCRNYFEVTFHAPPSAPTITSN